MILNATCLRYFNAAGAHKSTEIGESHCPETHLIPNILMSALSKTNTLKVFGDDYPTHDGTCIRDYIHVTDLAQAHLLGLNYMNKVKGFSAFNLGNGSGFSVLEIIKKFQIIGDINVEYKVDLRREGDPAVLVADNELAKSLLKWDPKYEDINEIIKSAWLWHSK